MDPPKFHRVNVMFDFSGKIRTHRAFSKILDKPIYEQM